MSGAKPEKNKSIIDTRIDQYFTPTLKPQIASAEQYARMHVNSQADNCENANADLMISRIMHTLQKIAEEIAQIKKGEANKNGAKKYRKNDRVVYIPKNQKVERVLAAFRKDPNEPLKVTILRLIDFTEKYLGRRTAT